MFGGGPTHVVEGTFAEKNRKEFTVQDIRFTTKGKKLYAIALSWLADGKVKQVRLIGHRGKLN